MIAQDRTVQLTDDGAKAYEDLKKILYAVEKIVGFDMNISGIDRLLNILTTQGEEETEIYQLQLLLQIFDKYAWKGSYSVGNWSISNGHYDLWFELYYNQTVKIRCISGELTVVDEKGINLEAVLKCILETYSNIRTGEEA